MQTKRKMSLTINETVFNALERASKEQGMAISHLAQKAIEQWLRAETEKVMAKGYEEMAEEDRAMAERAFDAQREVVS
jgi:hypothetical protein